MRDAYWEDYLYAGHAKAALQAWARNLRFFRFCRAYGGHATDADQLLVAIWITSEQELLATWAQLGIPVDYLPPDFPDPVPGQPHQTLATFPSRISGYPHLKQPGRVTLAGAEAHVWVHATSLEISVADPKNPYQVTEAAVQSAQLIEPLLVALTEQIIDPPLDNKYCVCPKYYPAIWEGQS